MQKRASPSKAGSTASRQSPPHKSAVSRQLAPAAAAAATASEAATVGKKAAADDGAAIGGVLLRAVRVIKSSVISSVEKLQPARGVAAASRRGLNTDRMAG